MCAFRKKILYGDQERDFAPTVLMHIGFKRSEWLQIDPLLGKDLIKIVNPGHNMVEFRKNIEELETPLNIYPSK